MKKNKKLQSLKENFNLFDSAKLVMGGGVLDPKPYPTNTVPGTGPSLSDWTPDRDKITSKP